MEPTPHAVATHLPEASQPDASPYRNINLLSLALGHFTVDFFSGSLPIVLATLTTPLDLSQAQVGLVAFVYSLSISLAQPLFGLVADSPYAPHLALLGALWQVALMGLTGLAGRFEVLLGMVAIGGLGSAMYHPPAAGSVPRLSAPQYRGRAMSVFLLGGNSGFALGPLIAGWVLNAFGARGTILLLIGGVMVLPFLAYRLLRLRYHATPVPEHPYTPGSTLDAPAGFRFPTAATILLALVIIFRSWASVSLTTYVPQRLVELEESVDFAGSALFMMALAAALGGFAAGFLADRIGPHRVIVVSLLLASPLVMAIRVASGPLLLAVMAGVGLCLLASLPLTLLLGQDLFPGRPGVMSGLTLGFTFIAGGVGAAATGAIAEQWGLTLVFTLLPLLPLLSGLVAMAFSLQQAAARRSALRR
jgi:FSR family fosmidomycin resistance protein-like MFS transporter